MNRPSFSILAQPDFDSDTASIAIVARWHLAGSNIRLTYCEATNGSSRGPAEREFIEQHWAEQTRLAKEAGRTLFDGRLLGLHGVTCRGGVRGALQPVRYSEYVATRTRRFKEVFPDAQPADPLGASTVPVTLDDKIVIGLRSGTDNNSATWYVPGGFVDPDSDVHAEQHVDIVKAVERELEEELGRYPVFETMCSGISYDRRTPHPEIHFCSKLGVTAAEAIGTRSPDGEFSELIALPNTPEAVRSSLVSVNGRRMCGAGAAALLLHGRIEFGDAWFFDAAAAISGPIL